MELATFLTQEQPNSDYDYQPRLFNCAVLQDRAQLETLIEAGAIRTVTDDYIEQLRELFSIQNPLLSNKPDTEEKFQEHFSKITAEGPLWQQGIWAYYPWSSTLCHILPHEEFQQVRTARNCYLINPEEQQKFYNTVVGIAGLSVGNSIALTIVLQGGAQHIKLADHDRMALSNSNRIRSGVDTLGIPKVVMTAREIYTLNPYATVEIFLEGLTTETIENFFGGATPLNIVVDEIDNLALKYRIREEAQKRKIPIVMGADNADGAVIDIERHDLADNVPFFHNRIGEVTYESLKELDKFGIGKMITKLVGADNVTERMQQSLLEMGKSVVSWPQLGGAAMINAAALAYCVRRIATGQAVIDDRAIIVLDQILDPDYAKPEESMKRQQASETFKKVFGI